MHRWKILGTAAAAMAASYAHGSFYGWIGIVRELPGRYAWLLSDVQALPTPIPAKGQLGLWRWEGDL